MAGRWGRDTMVSSIEGLTPGSTCTEAVLVQQRPRRFWLWLSGFCMVLFVVGVVIGVNFFPDGPTIVMSAFVGGLIGAIIALAAAIPTKSWVLARTESNDEHRVILAQSSKLRAKATRLHRSFDPPVPHTINNRLLTSRVTIDGESFDAGRAVRSRLERIVA